MKSLPTINNRDLRRKGYALMGDILLPIFTKGMVEMRRAKRLLNESQNFPIKVVVPDEDEKRALIAFGYDLSKLSLSIKRIDESSKEFKEFEEKMDKMNIFLQVAINIDLSYPMESELLWEHLGLKNDEDYIGMAEWLAGIGMEKKEYEEIMQQIEIIKKLGIKDYSQWLEKTNGLFKEYLIEDDKNEEGS